MSPRRKIRIQDKDRPDGLRADRTDLNDFPHVDVSNLFFLLYIFSDKKFNISIASLFSSWAHKGNRMKLEC